MFDSRRPEAHGRGAQIEPPNRFGQSRAVPDLEHVELDEEYLEALRALPTQYLPDSSRSIISENDSPDIPFRYSLNPYRGCLHGCAYCYARPTHEYLGLNAGLDFETKIFVKERAPELFRDWLARSEYRPEVLAFSGVTDCYQPAEKQFELTRRCLQVALEARQPVGVITKNALIVRDVELLSELAQLNLVHVTLSITTLDGDLARDLEPRTSTPEARLRAVQQLRQAGIRAGVMIAPIIPGLNDSEIPAILKAAAEAGAVSASHVLLRLPLAVKPVFLDWLERNRPELKERVESRQRACRDGQLSNSEFDSRMRGSGPLADQIHQTFQVFARRYGLDQRPEPLDLSSFRPPRSSSGQLRLF